MGGGGGVHYWPHALRSQGTRAESMLCSHATALLLSLALPYSSLIHMLLSITRQAIGKYTTGNLTPFVRQGHSPLPPKDIQQFD